ncbi:MAG: twin-arginine translocation pathway signal [Holophagales bacterium]|nr:twin-arginine translocation pathway signal [Holophagales bacterium]MYF97046.1 twin-arginine translocation pathway signal [Holophagales bacterium]
MKYSLSRRGLLGLLAAIVSLPKRIRPAHARQQREQQSTSDTTRVDKWHQTRDRVWLGESFWANPMEDWSVVNGGAETRRDSGDRSVHLLTHRLTSTGSFEMSVHCRRVKTGAMDGGAGFRIGIRHAIDDYRSNCFVRAGGMIAGLINGSLTLGTATSTIAGPFNDGVVLILSGAPGTGSMTDLTLKALSAAGTELGTVTHSVAAANIAGNVAIVSNFDRTIQEGQGGRYRFSDWKASGSAFEVNMDRRFGAVLWAMYTLDDTRGAEGFVVKLTAILPPLGAQDDRRVELLTQRSGNWRSHGFVDFNPDAYTATFKLANWDQTTATPYRFAYRERHADGSETIHEWQGTIRANPTGGSMKLAALTCQKDYSFPYVPLAREVAEKDPDLLFFSGDQVYEDNGGYGIVRNPASLAILSYLRKFYMFGWAFREAMRDRPTVCIPDDHDVFQGNLWGESGNAMGAGKNPSSNGGYIEPVRMVNVVHHTHTSHHPDPYDSRPANRGISVYYGDLVYGNVSFAIVGDRQFKSGPERVNTGVGPRDHVYDDSIDTATLDAPGLHLLGRRQEDFLAAWSTDRNGHAMKVLLSQTLFAAAATHHGARHNFIRAIRQQQLAPDAAEPPRAHPEDGEVPACVRRSAPAVPDPVRRRRATRQLLGVLHACDQHRLGALVAAGRAHELVHGGQPAESRAGQHRRVPRRFRQLHVRLCRRQSGDRAGGDGPLRHSAQQGQRLRSGHDRHDGEDLLARGLPLPCFRRRRQYSVRRLAAYREAEGERWRQRDRERERRLTARDIRKRSTATFSSVGRLAVAGVHLGPPLRFDPGN